jgi:D-alanyl-D-alanine-carboxypeptidase/D-alanyl-D-alanine-endopeptidase
MNRIGRLFAAMAVMTIPTPALAEIDAATIAFFEDQVAKGRYPGVMVAVVQDGEVSYRGFGVADKATGAVPDADTPFEIGSITKTFTGLLLAELEAEGKVELDDPVERYIPDGATIPQVGPQPITLRDLAVQRSGLPRLPADLAPANPLDPYADYDEADLWGSLAALTPARAPDAGYEYSNLGYGLLGTLIARASGGSYAALLEERIFAPLGMEATGLADIAVTQGYMPNGTAVPPWKFDSLAGAGAIRSTARDMVKYLKANLGESGPEELQAAALSAQQPRAELGGGIHLGLAWMTMPAGAGKWHNGGTYGFNSFAGVDREKRRAVLVWTNVFDLGNPLDAVGMHLLNPELPLPARRPAKPSGIEMSMPAAEKAAYVGSFKMEFGPTLTVTLEGNQLMAQLSGQPAVPVFPSEPDRLFYRVVEAELAFTRDADGKVDGVTLLQNGAVLPGKRLEP